MPYKSANNNKRKLSRIWTISICCLLLLPSFNNEANAVNATEYEVKAAYIYHFTQFIDWPEKAFSSPQDGFNICIMGKNPFGKALIPILKRNYKGHPFNLKFPDNANDARNCHLLYLTSNDSKADTAILEKLKDAPVLTVSSQPGFVERGGGIGFLLSDSHVRFSINRTANEHIGIVSSAKLLELAVRVVDKNSSEQQK